MTSQIRKYHQLFRFNNIQGIGGSPALQDFCKWLLLTRSYNLVLAGPKTLDIAQNNAPYPHVRCLDMPLAILSSKFPSIKM